MYYLSSKHNVYYDAVSKCHYMMFRPLQRNVYCLFLFYRYAVMKDYKLSQLITSAAVDGVDGELALHELKVVNFNHIGYHQQNQDGFYTALQTFLTLPVGT